MSLEKQSDEDLHIPSAIYRPSISPVLKRIGDRRHSTRFNRLPQHGCLALTSRERKFTGNH